MAKEKIGFISSTATLLPSYWKDGGEIRIKLNVSMKRKNAKFIGIVGTNGAGKSVICDYLSTKGFAIFSLSDIVRRETKNVGWDLNRDNLVKMGGLLKSRFGESVLAQQVYSDALENGLTQAAFDSIRHLKEVLYLKDKGVHILGIDAPLELRYERIQQRKKDTDSVNFDTFKKQDERENKGLSSGQNIHEAFSECAVIIENADTLTELHCHVDAFLDQM